MSLSSERTITLSPEEKRLYGQLFKQCDPEGLGIVTGEVAKTLFSRSGLAPATLGEIWQISDSENQGFLNQIGFSLALRIIGQAQGGQTVSLSLGDYPGPLPKFDGQPRGSVSSPAGPGILSPAPIAAAQVPVSTGGPRVPALNPNDRTRFIGLFSKSAPNGYLDGEVARNIFLKARLPNETLGQIWNLADTDQRGSLNQAEFVVAMHLIQCTLNGSMKAFPDTLPPALFEAAAGRPASRQSVSRVSSSSGVFQQPVARQYTGGSINSAHRQPVGPASAEWQISPKERARFDGIFSSLDTAKKGTIGAGEVVPFLTTSKLPEEALAQVWDLADVNNMGEFTKNEFAIAMYLVQQRLQGRQLPSVLPQSLLYTPNSRQSSVSSAQGAPNPVFLPNNDPPQQQQQQQQRAVAQVPPTRPVPQQNNSSINDLAQLNDLFSTPTPPATAAFKPASPVIGSPRTTSEVKHFVPTSTFGQSITRHDSGLQGQSPQLNGAKQLDNNNTVSKSLLVDDPESAKKLSDATTEFGNLSNQISTLTSQTVDLQTKRQGSEQELQQILARKQEIEGKLAALRSNYDEEVRKVKEVEQQLTQARQETQQKTQEFNVLEASFNALHAQFEQSTAQLTSVQQESASLKEKINTTNEQVAKLKSDLESAEKELKQHQDRVAVSQQQLATSEADRTIAENDLNKTRELVNEAAQVPTPPVRAAELEKDLATSTHGSSVSPPAQPPRQNSANPFFSGFGGNAPFPQATENVFDNDQNISDRQRAFEESFGRLDVTSPSTVDPTASSRNTVDTPNSSPPASDFQYNAETNSNAGGFTLPIVRPESATSSVQNNPPLSQRGDISQPGTPDENAINFEEKQNQIDQLRQGSLATLTADDEELYQPSSKGDDARHSTDSFEMVNAESSDKEQGESPASNEVRREDIVGASVIPGGFPPSEAATSEISTKDWAENQQYNTEFSPIHEVEHFDESSSDDEGPEDITKGGKQFNPVTAGDQSSVAATAGDDNNDVGTNADSTSSIDGNLYTSAPSSPSAHPVVPLANVEQFRPDESHIQTPKLDKGVEAATEQKRVVTDPFASAFSDLSEAKQDQSDIDFKFNNDYDDFQATFDSAFENVAPAATSASTSTPVPPASLPAVAAPATSNDEWEQLFAGFSNNAPGAPPVASSEDINSAFKLPQQTPTAAPPAQGIPPVQGIPPAARAAPIPNRNTPHSQAILELTGMGFSQQDAIEALHKKDFDLAEATNYLLDK